MLSISFRGKKVDLFYTSKKKTHVDSVDEGLSTFAVYCTILLTSFPPGRAVEMFAYQEIIQSDQWKLCGFARFSYNIDFCCKAACNLSIIWGECDNQLYLMKFTGQAKFVEVGAIILMGAPFLPLDPTIHSVHSATTSTEGPNAAKTPVLSATTAELATETTQLTAMMTPSKTKRQTDNKSSNAEALLSETSDPSEYFPLN